MPIGLVGVGRMGRTLAAKLSDQIELVLFDRDDTRLAEVAAEYRITTSDSLESLAALGTVILVVPDREVISCIKIFNQLQQSLTVINVATNVDRHVLREIAAKHVKCISAKIIGQADEMMAGQRPVIIVDDFPAEISIVTAEIFNKVGDVIIGRADLVAQINRMAAEKVLTAAVTIEEALRQQNITDQAIIKNAIGQVAVGTLKAYADSNLGPFAREIVQAVRAKMRTK
ncbi:hypothetical protein SDC9_14984 [bioreactor metagenome]|uniref:6-phosphogluconate dehydrogenase NADP-binding domain-containing protein n=1 Tax=bioreactor metagenome TaxID=1076179 RepID=A0A644TQG4_9ZZZZ|nr:NAD(P)-binding domain-containing protein [Negativicutes bacterium]